MTNFFLKVLNKIFWWISSEEESFQDIKFLDSLKILYAILLFDFIAVLNIFELHYLRNIDIFIGGVFIYIVLLFYIRFFKDHQIINYLKEHESMNESKPDSSVSIFLIISGCLFLTFIYSVL